MSDPYADDVLDELERYNSDFKPNEGRRAGVDVLDDGAYDFEIVSAELGRTEKQRDPIVRMVLKVTSPGIRLGTVLEHGYPLTSQMKVDILGGDLATLGFDTDRWSAAAGRPFSKELAKALPKLRGLLFRGQKKTTDGKDRNGNATTYHNLYINAPLHPQGKAPPAAVAPATTYQPPAAATVMGSGRTSAEVEAF